MALDPTAFIDDATVTIRASENTGADFFNGVNRGGSCAPGIGINQGGGAVDGRFSQFTLLDQGPPVESGEPQVPLPREAQISQHIGGDGLTTSAEYPSSGGNIGTLPDSVIRFGDLPTQAAKDADSSLDGTITFTGNSTLSVLATGWTIQA